MPPIVVQGDLVCKSAPVSPGTFVCDRGRGTAGARGDGRDQAARRGAAS